MRRLLAASLAALTVAAVPVLPTVVRSASSNVGSDAAASASAMPTHVEGGVSYAGVASRDVTWHLGASGGQFADTAPGITPDHYDPHLHATRKAPADTVGSRILTRALVVEGADGNRTAVIGNDLYLPNDLLNRRVGQLLEEHDLAVAAGLVDGPLTGITDDSLAVTVSHNHNSAFYSTPAWGTWVFQDVFDVRFFEYYAQHMADAVIEAAGDMRPVRMGAATVPFNEIQSHTYGPKVAIDGTPAGQPYSHVTGQLSVVAFEDITDPANPTPWINWVTLGLHPEWTWGYDVINGDITHAAMRIIDRELGTTTVMSQRETGSSGPHKDLRVHEPEDRREFQDNGLEQLDHGARIWADAVYAALDAIDEDRPVAPFDPVDPRTEFEDAAPIALLPWSEGFVVDSVSRRFAPPNMRPVPGVSNCNTRQLFHGDVQAPILGFPDCTENPDSLGVSDPLWDGIEDETGVDVFDLGNEVVEASPIDEAALYDELKAAGVPIPDSYTGTAFTAVEETAAVRIMAMRIGDLAVTFCPCEQFTDTALNVQTRLDRDPDTLWVGWSWEALTRPDGSAWCQPGASEDTMSCADPRNDGASVLPDVPTDDVERMRAQISNDAAGWESDVASMFGESESADTTAIFGSFTHEQQTEHGYGMVVSVGMANDYFGYMPQYREMRAHEHYRKALNGLGLHGADFVATRMVGLAAELNGATPYPTTAQDLAYQAESARADALARGLGHVAAQHTVAYDSSLRPDGGTPRILEEPTGIERFDGAEVSWVGGSNWTDQPLVHVERETAPGVWTAVGDGNGEVQTRLDFPTPADALAIEAGSYEWTWHASFEAFASELLLPELDGTLVDATPAGTYRFVIAGDHRSGLGGAVTSYALTSAPFTVTPWSGITADVTTDVDGVTVAVGPTTTLTLGDDTYITGPIDYPDTWDSSFGFIDGARHRFTYRPGTQDDQFYCRFCRFRPWVDAADAASVRVTVLRADGSVEQHDAVADGLGSWRVSTPMRAGDHASVAAGHVRDAWGNTNGAAG